MKLRNLYWYKKYLPIFHLESAEFFDKHVFICVYTVGPFLLTRSGNVCGEKKQIGMQQAQQFYRTFGLRWLIGKVSTRARLTFEIDVAVRHLSPYRVPALNKKALMQARYIWAEKGFRDHCTVDDIYNRIVAKHQTRYLT
jgi:hypothetical protein